MPTIKLLNKTTSCLAKLEDSLDIIDKFGVFCLSPWQILIVRLLIEEIIKKPFSSALKE